MTGCGVTAVVWFKWFLNEFVTTGAEFPVRVSRVLCYFPREFEASWLKSVLDAGDWYQIADLCPLEVLEQILLEAVSRYICQG